MTKFTNREFKWNELFKKPLVITTLACIHLATLENCIQASHLSKYPSYCKLQVASVPLQLIVMGVPILRNHRNYPRTWCMDSIKGCGLCWHVWLIWCLRSGANQAWSSCPLRNSKDNPGTWCMYSMMKSTCALITAVHMTSIQFPQHSEFQFRHGLGQSACLFLETAKTFKGPGAWILSMDVESNWILLAQISLCM